MYRTQPSSIQGREMGSGVFVWACTLAGPSRYQYRNQVVVLGVFFVVYMGRDQPGSVQGLGCWLNSLYRDWDVGSTA